VKVNWSDRALERIYEIADHIALDDPVAAGRWAAELLSVAERLTELPLSGRVVPEIGDESVREVIFGAYRILYQVGSSVEVLTVRHRSQLLRVSDVGERQT
jgi:toxin ParE1/3/4